MVDFATILAGLGDAFILTNILFVLSGVILRRFVGAMPGSSRDTSGKHADAMIRTSRDEFGSAAKVANRLRWMGLSS